MKSNSTQTKIHLQGYGGNKLLNLAGIYRFDPLNILGTKAKTLLMLICLFILSTSQMFAQIALRGTATTGTATGTSLTVAKPTGVAAGDIMIVNIAKEIENNHPLLRIEEGFRNYVSENKKVYTIFHVEIKQTHYTSVEDSIRRHSKPYADATLAKSGAE